MTAAEQNAMFDRCFDYDDHLRANGHWAGGETLQPAETALTVCWKNGKVANHAFSPGCAVRNFRRSTLESWPVNLGCVTR